jgi:hypothetical protein
MKLNNFYFVVVFIKKFPLFPLVVMALILMCVERSDVGLREIENIPESNSQIYQIMTQLLGRIFQISIIERVFSIKKLNDLTRNRTGLRFVISKTLSVQRQSRA